MEAFQTLTLPEIKSLINSGDPITKEQGFDHYIPNGYNHVMRGISSELVVIGTIFSDSNDVRDRVFIATREDQYANVPAIVAAARPFLDESEQAVLNIIPGPTSTSPFSSENPPDKFYNGENHHPGELQIIDYRDGGSVMDIFIDQAGAIYLLDSE